MQHEVKLCTKTSERCNNNIMTAGDYDGGGYWGFWKTNFNNKTKVIHVRYKESKTLKGSHHNSTMHKTFTRYNRQTEYKINIFKPFVDA